MSGPAVFWPLVAAVVVGVLWFVRIRPSLRRRRRARLRAQPFPEEWRELLRDEMVHYRRLPAGIRERVEGHVLVLLAEKNWEAAGGLELSDEMCVLIAAQASLLLLGEPDADATYFPRLYSIIVYPTAYWTTQHADVGSGQLIEYEQVNLGESWDLGSLILSWEEVDVDLDEPFDGHNVVLHEFAHQLDQADGTADGVPSLGSRDAYAAWSTVFQSAWDRQQRDLVRGRKPLLDPYGAEGPAEFFAVATEAFFERSRALRRGEPELYACLVDFYGVDPAEWETR